MTSNIPTAEGALAHLGELAMRASNMREEWSSIVTIMDDGRGHALEQPFPRDRHPHASEAAARHFKEWREGLSTSTGDGTYETIQGHVWPKVTIQLRRRFVTDWEDVD